MISFSSILSVLLANLSYTNIGILMALESSIFPVPSELVIIPAGLLVFSGVLSWYWVMISSLIGGLIGSLLSYLFARHLGRTAFNHLIEKYGSFLLINKEHMLKTEKYFATHGNITVFIGRLIPVVRHLISFPAGFSRMPIWEFSLFTLLGAGVWSAILLCIGYLLGLNKDLILNNPNITLLIVGAIIALVLIFYILFRKKHN